MARYRQTEPASGRGVTSVEYAIMAAAIAVVILGAVNLLGSNVDQFLWRPVSVAVN